VNQEELLNENSVPRPHGNHDKQYGGVPSLLCGYFRPRTAAPNGRYSVAFGKQKINLHLLPDDITPLAKISPLAV